MISVLMGGRQFAFSNAIPVAEQWCSSLKSPRNQIVTEGRPEIH